MGRAERNRDKRGRRGFAMARPEPGDRSSVDGEAVEQAGPPVLRRSAWLQPPSDPREGCEAFHDFDSASSRKPSRSICPSIADPWLLLVQFLQVRSSPGGNARPSIVEPVSASCSLGLSPRPLVGLPFSESAVCLVRLLAPCSSSTLFAITTPLAFCHGPAPMRSRALMALACGVSGELR